MDNLSRDDAGEHPTGRPDNTSQTGSILPEGQQHFTREIIARYTRTKQWKYSPKLSIAYNGWVAGDVTVLVMSANVFVWASMVKSSNPDT